MYLSLKWILLVLATASIYAQEPRKKNLNNLILFDDQLEDISCSTKSCMKRSPAGPVELGPFWANRGKKDPVYAHEKLFVEEPHWILVRRDKNQQEKEPFYVTRGKKAHQQSELRDEDALPENGFRAKRQQDGGGDDSPFFAARGKKPYNAFFERFQS